MARAQTWDFMACICTELFNGSCIVAGKGYYSPWISLIYYGLLWLG